VTSLLSHCPETLSLRVNQQQQIKETIMPSTFFNRRKLMGSLAAACSAIGAGTLLSVGAAAKSKDGQVKKLNRDGKPADGKQMITALITHNGLLYIAGQGANSNGPVGKDDIDSHVTKVMENVKELVETGGGTMDSILQLTVFLANLSDYDAMNKIFKTYFPNGGPARTTVAVAGLPGQSLVEINCIAAIVKK
jgi:2-iminobutanoate/2-iminopropanoate deaminase